MSKPILTLTQFMRRQQVIKQYRAFIRTAKRLPEGQAEDILNWVRADFKANSLVAASEEDKVKSLLAQGERMLKELRQNVDLATASYDEKTS